jgi:hypothetical protein
VKDIQMKRITALITHKNNEKIERFKTDFINETKENMSYAEALNWLLNFGASTWFLDGRKDLRKRFYKIWAKSSRHRKYEEEIDAFDVFEFIQRKREDE